jgi:hypothetical protein
MYIVYHGTDTVFDKFDNTALKNVMTSESVDVIYATDSVKEAVYAGSPDTSKVIIMKLEILLNNPLTIDAKNTEKNKSFGNIGYSNLIRYAKLNYHDSVIIKNIKDFSDESQTTYILFNSNQINKIIGWYKFENNKLKRI